MLDLALVNWRQDLATRRYVETYEDELSDPSSMSPSMLAGATTYCRDSVNPYSEELARRAGLLEKYLRTTGVDQADVVRQAANGFSILLV